MDLALWRGRTVTPEPAAFTPDREEEVGRLKRILRVDRKTRAQWPLLASVGAIGPPLQSAVDEYFEAAERVYEQATDREAGTLQRWRNNDLVAANNVLIEQTRSKRQAPALKAKDRAELDRLERVLSQQERFSTTRRIYRPFVTPLGVDPVEWARSQYQPGEKFMMPGFSSWTADALTITHEQVEVVLEAVTRQGACLDVHAEGDFEVLHNRRLLYTVTRLAEAWIGERQVLLVTLLEDSARGRARRSWPA